MRSRLLFPSVAGLAVDLVDGRLGDGHRARIAGQEEVHVIHLAVGPHQVHAGEVPARAEIGQILGVDPDQLEPELLPVERQMEVTVPEADLLFDVLFNSGLNVSGDDIRHQRRRRCSLRPAQVEYH